MPWNKEIAYLTENFYYQDGRWHEQDWRQTIPHQEIYNWVYLQEIREEIGAKRKYVGLSAEQAAQRYADY
jgi:hypothetical protein